MSLGSAFRGAYRTLVARPSDVLPLYLAGLAVPAVVRTIPLLGLLVGYLSLVGTGRLDRLRAVLEDAAPIPIDDPEAAVGVEEDAMVTALEEVVTPTTIAVLVGSMLLAIVAVVVVDAAISAGQTHAVFATLRNRRGIRPAIDGAFSHASTFVALAIAEFVVWAVLVGIVAGVGAVAAVGGGPAAAALVSLVALLFVIPVAIALRLVFAFARPAAVVDDVGVVRALRGATGQVTDRPAVSVGYGLLAVVFLLAGGLVSGVGALVGAGTVGTLVVLLTIRPLLELVKTALYADASDHASLAIPPEPERAPTERLAAELRRGWAELGAFTRDNVGLVAASTALFAGSIAVGLVAGGAIDHVFEASIERRLAETNALGFFVELATNNWSVSVAQSYAGFAFGIPTVVSLLLNGLNLGVVYQLETAPEILLAFVLPHGVVEIPGLILSGALGLALGIVAWNYVTGDVDRNGLATAVERAYRVLIGLAILFVVAAAIEAFVSPYYWRFLGL